MKRFKTGKKGIRLWIVLNFLAISLLGQSIDGFQPELITDRQGLPQGFIPGIVQDHQGFIWMATRDGLCRYDGNRFKIFRAQATAQSTVPFSSVAALLLDHRGRIWITSETGELVLFDPRTETFTNLSRHFLAHQPFAHYNARQYYPDRQNRLWILFDGQGLVCYDLATRRFRWFRHQADNPNSLASDNLRSILQDRQGRIWIATVGAGLERFEENTGQFVHYRPDSRTPLALPELTLFGLYQQPSGDLLLGTHHYVCRFNPETGQLRTHRLQAEGDPSWPENYLWGYRFVADKRGVVYFDQRDRLFRITDQQSPELLTRFTPQTGFCISLCIDRSDVLWLGTDGSGVRKYDLRTYGFRTARYQKGFQNDLLSNWLQVPESKTKDTRYCDAYMFRFTLDHRGGIWANVGNSTFYYVHQATHRSEKVIFPEPFFSTTCPLTTDNQGVVWAVHWQKNLYTLWYYNPQNRQWIRSSYQIDWKRVGGILQLVADQEAFWLASEERGLFRFDRRTGSLQQFSHQNNRPTSLSSNRLYCLSADPGNQNRLWIGTFGSGLCVFDKRSGKCQRITDQQGLPNNVIYSVLPDEQGNVWMGTNKGLCRLNRQDFTIKVYTTEDGLLANEFNRFHSIRLPNNQIIMGGVEGLTAFQPEQLKDDRFEPKVELTSLQINNRLVEPGSDPWLRLPIQAVQQVTLAHHQNFVTIQFAALQYNRPGKNRYRYRLEGIDQQWVETAQAQAGYTALAPGRYTLRVNASNTSGFWSSYVRQLTITILPPWWQTWWAYLLYSLIIFVSLWYGFRLYLHRLRLQQTVELRQHEARQLREMDEIKSRFFTNVTHDFRTPLTLILSPMAGLIEEFKGTRHQKRLESIRRNANQLLAQVNQLLDFSKLDAQAMTVVLSRGDVGEWIQQTLHLFQHEAERKAIELTYHNALVGSYWFDADKLERIVGNLVSNALKFTPNGGQITVSAQAADGIILTVSDTGLGIAADKLNSIFDRFFQVEDASGQGQTGTGIGLALVKELIQMQQGQITVESQPGQGTRFRVSLPYRRADDTFLALERQIPQSSSPAVPSFENGNQPHLLLVEDNAELAEFIADSLPAIYRISRAANGADGLAIALADQPDLVISDVMMPVQTGPEMDGYTLCQHLKTDERTNHIPVILLTARAALESRLEGLGRGADDYLTKPFHMPELILRIHNLLEGRLRLRERVRFELIYAQVAPNQPLNPVTQDPFLEKLYTVLEVRLDDTALGVESLADELGMSRMHLHRKVKALTGLAPSEVIRNYRLKRAKQLLRQGFNSSETAYRVGFDSPPYFAKCFRDLYQMSPSEFVRQD